MFKIKGSSEPRGQIDTLQYVCAILSAASSKYAVGLANCMSSFGEIWISLRCYQYEFVMRVYFGVSPVVNHFSSSIFSSRLHVQFLLTNTTVLSCLLPLNMEHNFEQTW